MRIERHGNVEVRYDSDDPDSEIDEIVLYDADGKCIFHLERMDETCVWMRTHGQVKDFIANVWKRKKQSMRITGEWETP